MYKLYILSAICFLLSIELNAQIGGGLSSAPAPFHVAVHSSCDGAGDGELSIYVDLGYDYGDWSFPLDVSLENNNSNEFFTNQVLNVHSTLLIENLQAGEYTLTIDVTPECQVIYEVTIEEENFTELSPYVIVSDAEMSTGCTNGEINVQINNDAVYPVTVIWYQIEGELQTLLSEDTYESFNHAHGDMSDVQEGEYLLIIEDSNCSKYESIVTVGCECDEACYLLGDITNTDCNAPQGESPGEIHVEIQCALPTSGVIYSWDDGLSTKDRTDLDPGEYCLKAEFPNGCVINRCWTVGEDGTSNCVHTPSGNEDFCIENCTCTNGDFLSVGVVDSEPANMEYGLFRCKADMYCGATKVGMKNKEYDKEWAFIFDYPFFTEWNYENPCAEVKICPIDNVAAGTQNSADMQMFAVNDTECMWRCRNNIFEFWVLNQYWVTNCCGICQGSPQLPNDVFSHELQAIIRNDSPSYFTIGQTYSKDSVFVKEYSHSAQEIDMTKYPGNNNIHMDQHPQGHIFYAGDFEFEPLVDFVPDFQGSNRDIFVIMYNTEGIEQWAINFGSVGNDFIHDLSVGEESIVLTGSMGSDLFINNMKIEANGNSQFSLLLDLDGNVTDYSIYSSSDEFSLNKSVLSQNGSVVSSGHSTGALFRDEDFLNTVSESKTGIFISSNNQDDSKDWNALIESSSSSIRGIDIAQFNNGLVQLVSFTESLSIPEENFSVWYQDLNTRFGVLFYDANGALQRTQIEGGVNGNIFVNDLEALGDNTILIAGNFTGSIEFSNGEVLNSVGANDIFIAQYNQNGEIISLIQDGGIGDDFCTGVAIANNSEIAYAGYFIGPESVINGEMLTATSNELTDFLVVLDGDLDLPRLGKDKDEMGIVIKNSLIVSPNPILNNEVHLEINAIEAGAFTLDIHSSSGVLIKQFEIDLEKGRNSIQLLLNAASFPNGVYFVRMPNFGSAAFVTL